MDAGQVVQLNVRVHGSVQGVGFRYVTLSHAKRLGIVGTVQNLPDGGVEIVAQGSQRQLDDLMEMLLGVEGPGKVDQVDRETSTPTQLFQDFRIVF
jgi:acylphosphatase